MIIGHGSLAKLLQDRDGAIFFCSGVGNSGCKDENNEFAKEIHALASLKGSNECLFYFSSINALYTESDYMAHKRLCEDLVLRDFDNVNVIRIGNIWECTNPHTFINAIRAWKENGDEFIIRDEMKYMISAKTLNTICQALPLEGKTEISVFEEMLTVKDCLKRVKVI